MSPSKQIKIKFNQVSEDSPFKRHGFGTAGPAEEEDKVSDGHYISAISDHSRSPPRSRHSAGKNVKFGYNEAESGADKPPKSIFEGMSEFQSLLVSRDNANKSRSSRRRKPNDPNASSSIHNRTLDQFDQSSAIERSKNRNRNTRSSIDFDDFQFGDKENQNRRSVFTSRSRSA